jgi:hypothetical protein
MADKKSFKLYKDSLCILDELDNEQAGVFIKAIKQYQETRTLPELDLLLRVVIKPFLLQFDRDDDAYEVVCEVNKVNGVKGGRPKKTEKTESVKNNPTEPKETEHNPTKPKKADTDTDTDTYKDTETKISESAHALIKFIKDKCPQVAKMKYPLTLEESERLVNDYSKTDIAKLFNEMDNWADLKKKTSANKTFRSWAQRGSIKKLNDQYKHTPKLINVNLPPQLVTELNNQFGLPLDWNEYDDFNRVTFIKKTPSIRHYFDLRGLGI